MGKHQNQPNEQLRNQMRRHMFQRNGKLSLSQFFRYLYVLALLQLQNLSADQACKGGPVRQRNSGHNTPKSLSQCKGYEHQQKDMRNSHNQIDEPNDQAIRDFPHGRGQNSHEKCNHRADGRRQKSDPYAHGKSRYGTDKHVSSHPVRSKWIRETGRQILSGKIRHHGSLRKELSCHRNCRQHQNRQAREKNRHLPPVHAFALPLLILGSTTP